MFTALKHATARLRAFFKTHDLDRDFQQELDSHVVMLTEENIRRGMSHGEARRAALIRVGAGASMRDQHRDARGLPALETVWRDVRYALRMLSRAPGFTAMAILTLALGIGANTAVFSAIDAVLLRPLPYPDGDRLMRLYQRQENSAETNIAPIRLEDWNRLNSTFQAIMGYLIEEVSDTSGDLPEQLRRAKVAPRFLEVWGIAPVLGRGFTDAEHHAGGPSAVLISDRYWRRRFGADPHVLNRTVRMESASFAIVGVMPASFLFPDREVDLWLPVQMGDNLAQVRYAVWYTGVGRLKPGVTLEQARANLSAIQTELGKQYPKTDAAISVEVVPLKENTVSGIRSSLWLLFGAVSVLLLITCTNIAALLLSRAADRKQEIAIRVSLGATRKAVATQMLTETLVLALAGGMMGLLLAAGASVAFRSAAVDLPRMDEITLDGRILLYTLVSAITVTLLCGALPAIRTAREDAASALKETGRTHVSTRSSTQWLLVGAQVALSVTLLAAAGLFVRSFYELSRVDPGFAPSRVLTFRVSGSWAELGNRARLTQRIDSTLEALRALPGVEAAATTGFSLPGVPSQYEVTFELVEAKSNTAQRMMAEGRSVSPEYFATMQIPLLAGEQCRRRPTNTVSTGDEVMVNRTFATRYLSGWASAVGLHVAELNSKSPSSRIVGVVGDAREQGLDRESGPTVYRCASAPNPTPYFLVRTRGEPLAIAQVVRLRMKELESLRSVYDMAPLEQRMGDVFNENRLRTVLLVLFAVTALALACVGLYGTLSYVVSVRRREVGLRLALGAMRRDIIQQFLGQGLRVVLVAAGCGLVLSIAMTHLLSGMLFGVSPSDPVTLAGVIGIVLTVTTLAALIPALRAALVEPIRALREE
jgi:putative ABC transport system permease protein